MSAPLLRLSPYEVVLWGESKDKPLWRVHVMAFSTDEAKADALQQFYDRVGSRFPVTRIDVCEGMRITPQQKQQGLFEDLAEVCLGSSLVDIQGAAVNLLLTAVQRASANLADAERRWDELSGRSKEALRRRYRGENDNRDRDVEIQIAHRLVS